MALPVAKITTAPKPKPVVSPAKQPPKLQGKTIQQWWKPAAPVPTGNWTKPPAQKQSPSYSGTTTITPPPATPAAPMSTDPRDATYWSNVYGHTATTGNQIAGYNKQIADLGTALGDPNAANNPRGTTLGELSYQQPLDVLAAQIAANRTGGLFSTSLAQHLGQIGQDYSGRRNKAISDYGTAVGNLAGLIAAAQTADQEYGGQQLEDAADRAATLAQQNPALGFSTVPPVNDPLVAPGVTPPGRVLVKPKGAPANARWAGPTRPGANWRGIGGGWWVPK